MYKYMMCLKRIYFQSFTWAQNDWTLADEASQGVWLNIVKPSFPQILSNVDSIEQLCIVCVQLVELLMYSVCHDRL